MLTTELNKYKVLLLDASYRPRRILPWDEALMLSLRGDGNRVTVVDTYGVTLRSVNREFDLPAVLALRTYYGYHRFKVRWSRKHVIHRDDYTCQYCADRHPRSGLTVDHVLPKSKGGRTSWTNTVAACYDCNSLKADRTPDEAGMPLLSTPLPPLAATMTRMGGKDCPVQWQPFLTAA